MLRHVADAQLRRADDLAAVWRIEAEQAGEQRRLAGTVGADEGDDLARADGEIDVMEHFARAVELAQAARLQ